MPKKNKIKGFILVETMVVIAFLATTLLTVYSSFTTVLDNAKTRIFYDDPIYLYRTYYFLSYLERNHFNDFIDAKFANTSGDGGKTLSIVEFGCGALSVTDSTGGSGGFCEKMKTNMEINHVFVMYYDVNQVVECSEPNPTDPEKELYCQRNRALQNLSMSAVNYLYTLDGYTGEGETDTSYDPKSSGYRIVIEFKKKRQENYEYYDYLAGASPSKKNMVETTYDYYYTTLEVPYGYDNADKGDAA